MNVCEKGFFKAPGLLIKMHVNNEKLQSNLANPEYKKSNCPFIYPNAQNQSKLYLYPDTTEFSI